MKITKVTEIVFDEEEDIKAATLSSANELVLMTSAGTVGRYYIKEQKKEALFSVKSSIGYKDGGFDIDALTTIYTQDSIVVVVNDFKRHGFVHYPGKYNVLRLWRGEYHADISCFPIALFKNEEGIPHLVYGKDWNHLQIMNLDTRQVLTAAKSLIEVNAEERHIEFYKNYEESNKLEWPRSYDYFFGELRMSPDNKHFLSKGWAWGSCDAYSVYEVDHFIHNNRIQDKSIGGWEHDDRAACWVDSETVAVAYNPLAEGDDDATKGSPQELHFYKVLEKGTELEKKIAIVGLDLVNATIRFNKTLKAFILYSNSIGVALVSLEGEILLQDETIIPDSYHSELNQFLKFDAKSVAVYRIE